MRKWNYIIFLALLVPRMQAKVENLSDADAKKLFREIDEFYFEKLGCPNVTIKPKSADLNKVEGTPKPLLDTRRMEAYERVKLINLHQSDPDFAKMCASKSSSNKKETLARTLGLISDIFQAKLCLILTPFECGRHHALPFPPVSRPFIESEPSVLCKPSRHVIVHPNGQAESQMVITCPGGYVGSIVQERYLPSAPPINRQPLPDQAICTPFEQDIRLPTGQVERQKHLNCLFSNQTSIIVPLVQNNQSLPGGYPTAVAVPQGGQNGNMNGIKPNINIVQSADINVEKNIGR